jgi:hypothetical protein
MLILLRIETQGPKRQDLEWNEIQGDSYARQPRVWQCDRDQGQGL